MIKSFMKIKRAANDARKRVAGYPEHKRVELESRARAKIHKPPIQIKPQTPHWTPITVVNSIKQINFFGLVHQAGGCGTEALGAVELLRSHKIAVRMICPSVEDLKNDCVDYLKRIGVKVEAYQPGLFKSCNVLVSFGEGEEMFNLIRKTKDRPRYLVYSDCMGWVSDNEVQAHKEGLIDEFFFETRALADSAGPEIARRARKAVSVRHGYKAFINTRSNYFPLRFTLDKPDDVFKVIRVARDDEEKYHPDTWRMFCGINAPANRTVKIEIAGWGDNGANKIGDPEDENNTFLGQLNLELHTHIFDPKRMADIYGGAHALVHIYDYTCEEALGRAFLEAAATGVIVIADNRGGAVQLIRHGETGYLVDSADEASYYASHLAFNEELRRSIASQAYVELTQMGHGNPALCWTWWEDLLKKA